MTSSIPSSMIGSSSPPDNGDDDGGSNKEDRHVRRRGCFCCKRDSRYRLVMWMLKKLTSFLNNGARMGDYFLTHVVMNLVGPLLIIFVLGICFVLMSCFWNVFYPWFGVGLKNIHAAFVCFVTTNILFHYSMCVCTSNKSNTDKFNHVVRQLAAATPNYTYPDNPQQLEQAKRVYQTVISERRAQQPQRIFHPWTLLQPTQWGFCFHTNQPKPPRSHYEHFTKSLVLNFDHYCPWMYNSIGYFNYRYFVSFLFYVTVGMMYGLAISSRAFLNLNGELYREQQQKIYQKDNISSNDDNKFHFVPKPYQETSVIFTFMICLSVGISVLGLGLFHCYLISTAQTTIEFHSNMSGRTRATRYHAYDVGIKHNWQQVFGKHVMKTILIPSNKQPDFLPVPLLILERLRRQEEEELLAVIGDDTTTNSKSIDELLLLEEAN